MALVMEFSRLYWPYFSDVSLDDMVAELMKDFLSAKQGSNGLLGSVKEQGVLIDPV